MHTREGSAAVSPEGDAPTPREMFLADQFARARREAGAAAAALAMACREGGPPERLDRAALSTAAAVAELRMALQALRLAS